MRHLVKQRGLQDRVQVDSAGTAAYHSGEAPDRRSTAHARQRGIILAGAARQFRPGDFERFDYVLALDQANFDDLAALAGGGHERLHLLRDFDAQSPKGSSVPDPYYGGASGFEEVLDQCEAACTGLLQHLIETHQLQDD